ncbi:MAG: hypothetical protein HYV60_19790 [Planctomycetia bacterium]|nr:hypothetical protein [Planctomycetia bacterium]
MRAMQFRGATAIGHCLLLAIPFIAAGSWFHHLEGFPQNDDPFYGRPVQIWVEEHSFQLIRQHGALSASSLGHIALGALVCGARGFSYQNLFLAVMLQAWLGAVAVYLTAVAFRCSDGVSLLLAATFCLTPLYFGHCFTFMTDVPAAAWLAVGLFCYVRGFRSESLAWMVLGSTATALAFWIRQTHILLLIFPLFVHVKLTRTGLNPIPFGRGLLAIAGIAILGVLLFESGLIVHNDLERVGTVLQGTLGEVSFHQTAIATYGLPLLLGMILLPLGPVLVAGAVRAATSVSSFRRYGACTAALTVGGFLITAFLVTHGRTYITSATGCFIQNAHFGPIFLSDMDEPGRWGDMGGVSWPVAVWQVLTFSAIANAALIAWWTGLTSFGWIDPAGDCRGVEVDRFMSQALFLTMTVMVLVILGLVKNVMDRYWLPLFPLEFAWLASTSARFASTKDRVPVTLSLILLVASFGVTCVFSHDFLVWNQVRWRQVQTWLDSGLQPHDFDGGRDVNAWLRSAEDPETRNRPGDRSPWWSGHARLALAIGPRPGWEEVGRLPWRAWATGREHHILVLRRPSANDQ